MCQELNIASSTRRTTAHLIDLLILVAILSVVSFFLPIAAPPVDAMSFYSSQDFSNYFSLVILWLVIASIYYLLAAYKLVSCTPGMWLTSLRYAALDGGTPTSRSIGKRFKGAFWYSLLILLPGPFIALIVVFISYSFFNVPFTTAADMLDQLGVPSLTQLAIHSLSFVALYVGSVYVFNQLTHKKDKNSNLSASAYDEQCGCTLVKK